jgi:hypothetical protein
MTFKTWLSILIAWALVLGLAHAAVPTTWRPVGVGGGGALFAPAWSPHHPGELYIACDMSEVFHSTDAGLNWSLLNFSQLQGGRAALVQFTSDPQILFSIDSRNDALTPRRSNDGGITWTPLANEPTGGGAFGLWTDPTRTTHLVLTDYTDLYVSTDGGTQFSPSRYSFPNGGSGLYVGGVVWDGANIYVGSSAGVLVSTNNGTSFAVAPWTGLPSDEAIFSFAGAKVGNTLRLYALTTARADLYPGLMIEDLFSGNQAKIWRIDVGQSAWSPCAAIPAVDDRPVFIAAARNDLQTVWLAGGFSGEDQPCVYKSTNAGAAWASALNISNNQNIFTGWAGAGGDRQWSYGGGIVGFAVDPTNAARAAFTDYGFCHVTDNGAATWSQAYVATADQHPAGAPTPTRRSYHSVGLEDTTCWRVTWLSPTTLWACFSDIRGLRSTDGGLTWGFDYSGHTENSSYACIKHPTTGRVYLATSSAHDLYQSTYLADSRIDGASGRVLVSTDDGLNWSLLHNFTHAVVDLAFDPNDAQTLYASVAHSTAGGIYVTHNLSAGAASTWNKLAAPPRTEGHAFNIKVLADGALVCTYSGRRTSAGAFTDSSGVFISTSGGTSWLDRSHANMHYWVKDVVLDPHDAAQNTWYVGVFSGWGGPYATNNDAGGLYRTINRGQSWTRLLDTSQVARVTSCTPDPVDPDSMYVTTETDGLWHTRNLRAAAPTFAPVATYPFRQPERVFFNPHSSGDVWVTSFGNGMRVGSAAHAAAAPVWSLLD